MKNLRGQCRHCGGRFDFRADLIGSTSPCPHCGQDTEMMLETPKIESGVPKRLLAVSLLAIVILGVGLVASMLALKRARSMVRKANSSSDVTAKPQGPVKTSVIAFVIQTNDFYLSAAALQKPAGAPLPLATGVLSNGLSRPRLGVQVSFDVLNAAGQKVGTTMDSAARLEPLGSWQFQAPLLQTNAASVRFAGIREEKQP